MPAKYSVLYVDDEPDLLEIARLFLEESQEFSVDKRESAMAALDTFKNHRYDAIVSDFEMPGMNGIAFLKAVRKTYWDLPFVYLHRGRSREAVVIEALNNGADFYLQKGGDPGALRNSCTLSAGPSRCGRSTPPLRSRSSVTMISRMPPT